VAQLDLGTYADGFGASYTAILKMMYVPTSEVVLDSSGGIPDGAGGEGPPLEGTILPRECRPSVMVFGLLKFSILTNGYSIPPT
jgi:hypothetical protein